MNEFTHIIMNPDRETYYLGYSLTHAIIRTNLFAFDIKNKTLSYRGQLDTVSYSEELSENDLQKAFCDRCIQILERDGWCIKRIVD